MKYAILKTINGHFFIHAEGFTDMEKALVSYHDLLKTLHNADDVITGQVSLVDEQLRLINGYTEKIDHTNATLEGLAEESEDNN